MIIGTPYSRNAGYYGNDDRASGGRVSEADIRTCVHCQRILKMQDWKKIENGALHGGFCMKCYAPICHLCQKKMQTEGCIPFMARIERDLQMVPKFKQFLKDAGMEPVAVRPIFTGLI